MGSKNKKTTKRNLMVFEGGSSGNQETPFASDKKLVYYILIFVILFLLAQVLIGWVWRHFSQRGIDVVWAEEGTIVNSFSVEGLVTFEEEVIPAPKSGFVYYQVDKGDRVPVGKSLAVISGLPLEEEKEPKSEENQEVEETGYLEEQFQRFTRWFLYGEDDAEENMEEEAVEEAYSLTPVPDLVVEAPKAGMVNFTIDGWESSASQDEFPYLDKSEFEEKGNDRIEERSCGEKVYSSEPLLKIMNNYRWYFSALVPPDYGELLAEKSSSELFFSFAPEKPVEGEIIEYGQGDNGDYEVTWQINREVEDYYNYRWSSAEIIYEIKEGIKIPTEAYVEKEQKEGVYIIDRGTVHFQEVNVLGEKEDYFLVEDLDYTAAVVTTPHKVKEGQHIN